MIVPSDILARIGADALFRHGTAFRRLALPARGGEQMGEIFTRADAQTCATFQDRGQILRLAQAGRLRCEWLDLDGDGIADQACLLLEPTVANNVLNNRALNTGWTLGASTVTADAIAAPDGTITGDKSIETAVINTHFHQTPSIAITALEALAYVGYFKAGERSQVLWQINNPAATVLFRTQLDLIAGTLSGNNLQGGATFVVNPTLRKRPDGWCELRVSGKLAAGDVNARVTAFLGNAGAFTYLGDGASGLYSWGHHLERSSAWPSSMIPTAGAILTRAQDGLSLPINHAPLPMTLYYKGVESGVLATGAAGFGFPRLLQIGKADNSGPRLILESDAAGHYTFIHDNGLALVSSTQAAGPAIGQVFELVCTLNVDGSVQLIQSIAGGAPTVAAASGPNARAAAWSDRVLWLGPFAGAVGPGPQRLIDCMLVRGPGRALAEFQAVP